ncbi:putative F-box/kelch-repeat protein [Cardamine amara subsp. amara]|uniref:F-box/kelch-repeat protein n=1 Tax=Cardamine amara subsp. amara TaxID=228776 RepID=A0ABD0ZP70_CARAN
MRVRRTNPAADVIDGKIYVIGGHGSENIEDWGEVYDPKTNTWEPVLPTTLDLTVQKSVVLGKFVMGGKVYAMDDVFKLRLMKDLCLVMIDNMLYQTCVSKGMLFWNDPLKSLKWIKVKGLKHMPKFYYLTPSANSNGGRRVTVWWEFKVNMFLLLRGFFSQVWF